MPAPVIEDRILGGPGQSLQNLLTGNLEGAIAAVVDPAELTPNERDAFLKKHGLDKGVYAPIFRLMTNPAVILTAALSMKFPVPSAKNLFKMSEKVSGYTSRFPILGKLASMQSLFRGTEVPELYSKIVTDVSDFRSRHGGELGTVLERFRQSTGKYPDSRDQKMVAMWLDGFHKPRKELGGVTLAPALEAHMTPPVLKLAKESRKILDTIYDEMYGTPEARASIIESLVSARKMGVDDANLAAIEEWVKEGGKRFDDYYPRRVVHSEQDFRDMVANLTKTAKESVFAKSASRRAQQLVGPHDMRREFGLVPSFKDLEEVRDVLDPEAYGKLKAQFKGRTLKAVTAELGDQTAERLGKLDLEDMMDAKKVMSHMGDEAEATLQIISEGAPNQYDLRFSHSMNSYVHTMASTYGWTVQGGGKNMGRIMRELGHASKDPVRGARAKQRLAMLENTYIPVALGRGTFQQSLKAQAWEQSMVQLAERLDNPTLKNLLGKPLHDRLTDTLLESRGTFSLNNLSRLGAGYFYLSTLGVNPASALKNLLQVVLTTGPTVGFRTAAAGAAEAMRKSHKYFAARFGKQALSHDEALRFAYPEFGEAGLVASPLVDEALQNTLQNAYTVGAKLPGSVVSAKEKISRGMMAMFSASEHAVRLTTFEAGMLHAKRSGIKGSDALKFSKKLVEATQFLTGPQNTPYALIDKNPLVRQLTQFPIKMLEYATDTALTVGSAEKNIFGLNPGTFSRAVLGSVVAYELGNSVGLDMKDALLSSAIPGFQGEGRPFAPIPIIPPAFQLLGAAAMDTASGEFDQLQRSLPLLVPGGVGLSRAVGLIPGGEAAARFAGRPYADYEARAPDGRIPVYTAEGRLRGFFTDWDVFMMGVGVRTRNSTAEQQLLQTIVANRDNIRQSRTAYIDALMKNDMGEAQKVSRNFKVRYGFELPVSQQNIKDAQLRRSIPRLEQVIRTLPPGEARDQMIQLLSQVLGAGGEAFLGRNPAELGQSRPQALATPLNSPAGSTSVNVFRGVQPAALSTVRPDADRFRAFN